MENSADKKQDWRKYYNPETASRASKKYRKANLRQIGLSFHTEHDADLLMRIDSEKNKAGYIKNCIRENIARTGWKPPVQTQEPEMTKDDALKLLGL